MLKPGHRFTQTKLADIPSVVRSYDGLGIRLKKKQVLPFLELAKICIIQMISIYMCVYHMYTYTHACSLHTIPAFFPQVSINRPSVFLSIFRGIGIYVWPIAVHSSQTLTFWEVGYLPGYGSGVATDVLGEAFAFIYSPLLDYVNSGCT